MTKNLIARLDLGGVMAAITSARLRLACVSLLAAVALGACGGGGGDTPVADGQAAPASTNVKLDCAR